MSRTAVKPKPETGQAGTALAPVPTTEYEKIRTTEIGLRARLYSLRIAKVEGQLLDRKLVEEEFAGMLGAVRQVIMQSHLSKKEREELFQNLLALGQLAENVTQRQKAETGPTEEGASLNTNGGIDYGTETE